MDSEFSVVPMLATQWRELRALRLEMLADSPLAFVEALESAQRLTDRDWQERAIRYTRPGCCALVAVDDATGRWIGTMSAYVDDSAGRPYVVAVYVTPEHRGRDCGVADVLLDGVEQWARDEALTELWLEVHEANPQAQAFYRRRGYVLTGNTRPYDLDPTGNELEMHRTL